MAPSATAAAKAEEEAKPSDAESAKEQLTISWLNLRFCYLAGFYLAFDFHAGACAHRLGVEAGGDGKEAACCHRAGC